MSWKDGPYDEESCDDWKRADEHTSKYVCDEHGNSYTVMSWNTDGTPRLDDAVLIESAEDCGYDFSRGYPVEKAEHERLLKEQRAWLEELKQLDTKLQDKWPAIKEAKRKATERAAEKERDDYNIRAGKEWREAHNDLLV